MLNNKDSKKQALATNKRGCEKMCQITEAWRENRLQIVKQLGSERNK